MAAPTFLWVWPTTGPAAGGEIRLGINQNPGLSPSVTIGGQSATILGNYGSALRISIPAHAPGAVDIVYTDSNGNFTATNAYTYIAGYSRFYLTSFATVNANIDLLRPNAKQCVATIGTGYNITSNKGRVLGPGIPPGSASGGVAIPVSDNIYSPTNGIFGGVDGFVSGRLVGIRKILAGNWKFAAAVYPSSGNAYENWDKLCIYIWRPSNNTLVGKIYDNTGDYSHPDGVGLSTSAKVWIKFTFSGSEVDDIQDGDILCIEWLLAADASHPISGYTYFNGNVVPGTDRATTTDFAQSASYLEAPFNLWLQDVEPVAVDSAEAFGTATVSQGGAAQSLSPSAIDTEEVFGTPAITFPVQQISPSAIDTAENVGSPQINLTVKPSDIASEEAVGDGLLVYSTAVIVAHGIPAPGLDPDVEQDYMGYPVVQRNPCINLDAAHSGIVSAESVSQPIIRSGAATVAPVSIISQEVVSVPHLQPKAGTIAIITGYYASLLAQAASYTVQKKNYDKALANLEAVHAHLAPFLCQDAIAAQARIESAISLWPPTNKTQNTIKLLINSAIPFLSAPGVYGSWIDSGVPSQQAVGTPTIRRVITLVGIVSLEAVGHPVLHVESTEIDLDDNNDGIGSLAAVGRPGVQPGPRYISPSGIVTKEAFGTPLITPLIRPEAIVSEEAVGEPTLTYMPVNIRPVAIARAELVGEPVLGLNIFRVISVESEEAFGYPIIIETGAVDVLPAAIGSQEHFGEPNLNSAIRTVGIDSEEIVGEPQLNLVIFPGGIVSKEKFGTIKKVNPGLTMISQRSIPSEGMVGRPYIKLLERTDLIVLESPTLNDIELNAGQDDLIVLEPRPLDDIELNSGQDDIDLYWEEREVVNG